MIRYNRATTTASSEDALKVLRRSTIPAKAHVKLMLKNAQAADITSTATILLIMGKKGTVVLITINTAKAKRNFPAGTINFSYLL